MLSNIAFEIKSALTMPDVCQKYGIEVNRQGFAICPFHCEDTPSLKIYEGRRGFYCYGCGKSGDVITFTQELFSLSFVDALKKLNCDFTLNLPLERKMSLKEKYALKEAEKRRLEGKKQRQALIKAYLDEVDNYTYFDKLYIDFKPKTIDEQPHPLFIWAIKKIEEAQWRLDEAEEKLFSCELLKEKRGEKHK